jgi:hypothetical protein
LVAGLFLVALSGGEKLHAQGNMQTNGSTGAPIVLSGSPGRIEQGPRTWSIFTEYSPNSSHIFLGYSHSRELVTLGASFSQRIFQHRIWSLDYRAEIRPLMVESDPVETGLSYSVYLPPISGSGVVHQVGHYQYPHEIPVLVYGPQSTSYTAVYQGQTYLQEYRYYYGRRWTYVGGLSPAGLQARLLPHSRIQPVFTLMTGFAVSPRDIPMFDTSSFNFTFSFGTGIDIFSRPTHAVRLEYRYHHLSNAYTGAINYGIDSQMVHVGYSWGK